MMGMTMIIGIVTEVAIFVFSEFEDLQAGGMRSLDALIAAGRNRMRPIAMTSIATDADAADACARSGVCDAAVQRTRKRTMPTALKGPAHRDRRRAKPTKVYDLDVEEAWETRPQPSLPPVVDVVLGICAARHKRPVGHERAERNFHEAAAFD
jgi:hypothetical protein